MHSHVYLDESGDLGWTLNKPYRQGGSSRFLTLGYLICPITHTNIPKRLVKDFYTHFSFNPKEEIKASQLKKHHKDFICAETVKMLGKYPDFHLGAITVNKNNVNLSIRTDGNVLYNYLMGASILDVVKGHLSCKITRDNRTVKTLSGHSCIEYLRTIMWMHLKQETVLTDNPTHSHHDDGIIFIDWITNIVWSKHEDNYDGWCNQLHPHLNEITIFF